MATLNYTSSQDVSTISNIMTMPNSMRRANPIPLDYFQVWNDYDLMAEYAKTSVVSYVGQILALVNEEEKTTTLYVISDTDGTLTRVDAGAAETCDCEAIPTEDVESILNE